MNDVERMSPAEQRLRIELQRLLTPPATPLRLLEHVDDLAVANRESTGRRWPWRPLVVAGGRSLRVGLAITALLLMAVAAGLLAGARREPAEVVTPHPTLPALVGPILPPSAATPTPIREGAWISGDTAWLIDDAGNLRLTTDGAQTWSEPRPLPPAIATFTGFEFLDADHGYLASATRIEGSDTLLAWRTADSGRTWLSSHVGSVPQAANQSILAQVHFTDLGHGIMLVATSVESQVAFQSCGPGFTSDDGGATWSPQPAAPCPTGAWWNGSVGVTQPDVHTGAVQVTEDGGRTWQPAMLPGAGDGVEFWPRAIVPVGPRRMLLVGTYNADGAAGIPPLVTLSSDDGGATWHESGRVSLLDDGVVQWLTTFDRDHWLALVSVSITSRPFQATELQETWDGGRTWAMAPGPGTIEGSWASWGDRLHGMLQGVDMGDCSNPDGSCGGTGSVFLTNDGGRTWHQVPF